ncbi:unnamed protein product [Adineta ricciae]|uniref:Uncharacterized protein n=1 Tax=Adineta ricciae TaxID=249248 RepID=A0A815I443_ADIRI|nr:unnamed protein product [Adineta ricciae]CAF1570347.1 unnamed protein product [Adineta ricciae]
MRQRPIIPHNKTVIWVSDYHISPVHDIKDQFKAFDVYFIDKSLSGACSQTDSCAKDLKVLTPDNGIAPSPAIRQQFYEAYKNDVEMNQVKIFMCFHSVAMCELFMPFNRTIIIVSSTRYEFGRHGKEDWQLLNQNLQKIASNPKNVIAGNNLYDAEYIRYFTGIQTIVLPSLCAYTQASYSRLNKKPFIITRIEKKSFSVLFKMNLTNALRPLKTSITVAHLREHYKGHYSYRHLAQHPGIIYVPYQVSVMSLFEQYRMNIPLFFPSLDLLTQWHFKYRLLAERAWDGLSEKYKNASLISGVLSPDIPDPNNELDMNAIRYWLNFSDFYQWPHITYYESTNDLAEKLVNANLDEIIYSAFGQTTSEPIECLRNEKQCGSKCYLPDTHKCNSGFVCRKEEGWCGKVCFNPATEKCIWGLICTKSQIWCNNKCMEPTNGKCR